MNKLLCKTILIVIFVTSSQLAPCYAASQTAGLPCSNPSATTIAFGIGSDAMDDLLACVSGTWHSMIYGSSVPSGGIGAFNLTSCPLGWVNVPALAGRTIIGVGSGTGLTSRSLYDFGGEELHTMTIGELVPHIITIPFGASDKGGGGNGYAYSDNAGGSTIVAIYNKTSDPIGGGDPFNVMMPYYALLYCMKQ